MTATGDKPTIGERYTSATGSSNLRMNYERRGDADFLIAAGLLPDTLGALLFRLCAEYDGVRGEYSIAVLELHRQIAAAKVERDAELAQRIHVRATNAAETARLLVLIRLDTLRETKDALGRFACIQATRRRFMRPDNYVVRLTGMALDVFLDPLCSHCHGRGFTGGSHRGEPRYRCRSCRETGHRKESVGQDEPAREFAKFLLAEMERSLNRAASGIKRLTSDFPLQQSPPKGTISAISTNAPSQPRPAAGNLPGVPDA